MIAKHSNRYIILVVIAMGFICLSRCADSEDVPTEEIEGAEDYSYFDFCTEIRPLEELNSIEAIGLDRSKREELIDEYKRLEAKLETEAVINDDLFWDGPAPVIKVQFLDGPEAAIKRVKSVAKKWEDVCGIKFRFGTFSTPDVTITFKGKGSYSCVGTYASEYIRHRRPSMGLGGILHTSSSEEIERTILHEFGHVLGFEHEHTNPDAHIEWDKVAVRNFYMSSDYGWDSRMIDLNIYNLTSRVYVNFTHSGYDDESIMTYEIPATLTKGTFSSKKNYTLSPIDEAYALNKYPK